MDTLTKKIFFILACMSGTLFSFTLLFSSGVNAASLYLPAQLSPDIEARVERLFVVANMPIIKRPIPISEVNRALKKIDGQYPQLQRSIKRYLERYSAPVNLNHANLALRYSTQDSAYSLPNQRGIDHQSDYVASLAGHAVLNDWAALNVGAFVGERVGNDKSHFYEGSFLSLGGDLAQLDVGFRPHWFGPFQESDMLISTHAAALPSVTLSNPKPLDFLGIRYEIFWARMSESDSILSRESNQRLSGNPLLMGLHLSFEPIEGFAIGFNRLMQYGGATREEGLGDLAEAFFLPRQADNIGEEGRDFGNQISSVTTRFTFPGKVPVSVYMEYAGEDTSATSDVHLGNSALMLGIHFPLLFDKLGATYEMAEWQNGWYVNTNYGDGLTHHNSIVGHWAGNQRLRNDAVGAKAQTLKLLWSISPTRHVKAIYRQVKNSDLSATNYQTGTNLQMEYAQTTQNATLGFSLNLGEDILGESAHGLTVFTRW